MLKVKAVTLALSLLFVSVLADDDEKEQNFEFHFEGIETVDGSDKYFLYNYTVDKQSELSFKISGNIQQLVQLDDGYGLQFKLNRAELDSDPPVYEEMMAFSKPVCEYLKSIYRMYFYDSLKDISNLPHYDTCPLPPADYWVKDYAFEGDGYKAFMRDGRFQIEFYLTKDDEIIAGTISVLSVKPVD